MSCRHVREWLHRDAASLDEAQRLQLDDHLASCESCRGDRERMLTLHRAGSSLESPPSDARMYDRAIARALLEGPRAVEPARARWMWPVAIGAAAAIAIVLALALRNDDAGPNGVASKGDQPNGVASKGDAVDVAPGQEHAVLPPRRVPEPPPVVPDEIVSPNPSNVDGADKLRVQIGASAMAGAATIDRDDVDVQPDQHVDPSTKHDGAAPKAEPVADVLARARGQLAAKQYADAERTAISVLAHASTTDEAEARTILADIAQASGQLELASTRYQEVASKFASLSAGESALYAAARVEVRRGRDARVLLERYLARYPSGRFVNDARRLLGTLPKEQR